MTHSLIHQTASVLRQLTDAINQLEHQDYKKPLETLSGSSIGQHVRHIIEFYQCMMNGYDKGILNYDQRVRDKMIEESREFAVQCINKIMFDLKTTDLSQKITLEVVYDQTIKLTTTMERELVYNIEHTIHHMALIKIGIKAIGSQILLPAEFGVATSTLKHQQHVHSNVLAQQ